MAEEFVLDPSRSYTAAEVQLLLNNRRIKELRIDLNAVTALAKETAAQIATLVQEVRELKGLVSSQEAGFAAFGTSTLSATEKAGLPAMMRAFQAGQQAAADQTVNREKLWRRMASIATVSAAVATAIVAGMAAAGVFAWFRLHVLQVPP